MASQTNPPASNTSNTSPQPQRRGRGPSPAKTAETKARIARAAFQLFTTGGFEGTRTIDVAQAANVGKGTLYRYYPTKEALFEGVLQEMLGHSLQMLHQPQIQSGETFEDFLRRAIRPLMEDLQQSHRTDLLRLILVEGARFPSLAQTYRRIVLDPTLVAIQKLAAQATERGELHNDVLVRYPILLLSPGLLVTVWNGLFSDDPLPQLDLFDAFIDVVC